MTESYNIYECAVNYKRATHTKVDSRDRDAIYTVRLPLVIEDTVPVVLV